MDVLTTKKTKTRNEQFIVPYKYHEVSLLSIIINIILAYSFLCSERNYKKAQNLLSFHDFFYILGPSNKRCDGESLVWNTV